MNKYYTKEGVIALENRLKNLTELYVRGPKYPFIANMYGFPTLKILSKEHHEGMIDNLCQILGKKDITLTVINEE